MNTLLIYMSNTVYMLHFSSALLILSAAGPLLFETLFDFYTASSLPSEFFLFKIWLAMYSCFYRASPGAVINVTRVGE